jgi:hypothetical protein
MNVIRRNDDERVRRNPADMPGKLRGGGDLTDDLTYQAENWEELVAEAEGQTESRISEAGNAQDAILAGTGDLDFVHRRAADEPRRAHAAAEDSPDLINPAARKAAERCNQQDEAGSER